MKLGPGDTIILRKLAQQNGKRVNAKLMLELVAKEPETSSAPTRPVPDQCKELLLLCIRDAVDIMKEAEIQFSNDELQKLATTLFIQRTRLA